MLMAERVGFEPTERFPVHSISSAASSTTPAPLQKYRSDRSYRTYTSKIWRRGWDSNPRWALTHSGFRDRCTNPLCDLSASLFCSSTPEKLLHQRSAFRLQDARADLNPMIQKVCITDAKPAHYGACLLVRRTINQTPDARLYQSARAHRARLDGRVNVNLGEPVIPDFPRGLAKSNDFSVGCGIAVGTRAVSGNSDEFVFADDASADGHFAIC